MIILLQWPQAGLPMRHLSIKVHPHRHGLGVLQTGWRNPERKIPHRNVTGDQKKTQVELVNIDPSKSTMETNHAMEKVFNIWLIYQDSLLHLFNIRTILHLQKTLATNYSWGGNEQSDWYRDHSLLKSLLQNPTLKRPARCQQQCTDHQEPQEGATVGLPVGWSMRVEVAFVFRQLVWQNLLALVNREVFHHLFRVRIRELCETTNWIRFR